jgi:hypothetical protein
MCVRRIATISGLSPAKGPICSSRISGQQAPPGTGKRSVWVALAACPNALMPPAAVAVVSVAIAVPYRAFPLVFATGNFRDYRLFIDIGSRQRARIDALAWL